MWWGATSCKRVPSHSCQEPSTKQDRAEHWQAISTLWYSLHFKLLGSPPRIRERVFNLQLGGKTSKWLLLGRLTCSMYPSNCLKSLKWYSSVQIMSILIWLAILSSSLSFFIFHFLSGMMPGSEVKSYPRSYSGENPLAWASTVMTLPASKSENCLLMHKISKLSQKCFSTLWRSVRGGRYVDGVPPASHFWKECWYLNQGVKGEEKVTKASF